MRNSETMRALRKSTIALESSAFFVGTIPFALQPASLRFQETYFHRDEDSLCREDIYLRLIDALLCDRHMGFCGANTYVGCRERLFRREDNMLLRAHSLLLTKAILFRLKATLFCHPEVLRHP